MLPPMLPPVLLSLVAVTALVIADFRAWRPGRYVFKPLAACAFIWLALALGAAHSDYGRWILAALAFGMLGDLCLMFEKENAFLAGLGSFLVGHLVFAVAFAMFGSSYTGLAVSAAPVVALLVFVNRWLLPHVGADMKIPVVLYVLVISAMLLTAGMTAGLAAAPLIIAGAWGFAVSDLAVARRQFVHPSKWNGVWGTPLYFGSQMVLAGSVALA